MSTQRAKGPAERQVEKLHDLYLQLKGITVGIGGRGSHYPATSYMRQLERLGEFDRYLSSELALLIQTLDLYLDTYDQAWVLVSKPIGAGGREIRKSAEDIARQTGNRRHEPLYQQEATRVDRLESIAAQWIAQHRHWAAKRRKELDELIKPWVLRFPHSRLVKTKPYTPPPPYPKDTMYQFYGRLYPSGFNLRGSSHSSVNLTPTRPTTQPVVQFGSSIGGVGDGLTLQQGNNSPGQTLNLKPTEQLSSRVVLQDKPVRKEQSTESSSGNKWLILLLSLLAWRAFRKPR